MPLPFVITSVPDQRLGQAVTLLIAGQVDTKEIETNLQNILELKPYYRPRYILTTDYIPQTKNGKISCADCRALALRILQQ